MIVKKKRGVVSYLGVGSVGGAERCMVIGRVK